MKTTEIPSTLGNADFQSNSGDYRNRGFIKTTATFDSLKLKQLLVCDLIIVLPVRFLPPLSFTDFRVEISN